MSNSRNEIRQRHTKAPLSATTRSKGRTHICSGVQRHTNLLHPFPPGKVISLPSSVASVSSRASTLWFYVSEIKKEKGEESCITTQTEVCTAFQRPRAQDQNQGWGGGSDTCLPCKHGDLSSEALACVPADSVLGQKRQGIPEACWQSQSRPPSKLQVQSERGPVPKYKVWAGDTVHQVKVSATKHNRLIPYPGT